ncbi:hypothetical protein LMG1231_06169 [Achromobacter denitrificans]|nr:hypothetical protein LMG1231_06169 [Achromobacter denitrificans]
MRGAPPQAQLRVARRRGVGMQRQPADADRHERQAQAGQGFVLQQVGGQLERAVQPRGRQVRAVRPVIGPQRGEHGVRVDAPAAFDQPVGRAIVQADGACQRLVVDGQEIGLAIGRREQGRAQPRSAGLGEQPGAGMQGPAVFAAQLAGLDADPPVVGFDRGAHQLGRRGRQQQRSVDLQVFQFGVLGRVPLERRGQRHFRETGAGEDHRVAHDVVAQRRLRMRVELVFPGRFVLGQAVAQQGVHPVALEQAQRFGGVRMPVALALPGVGRQGMETTGARKKPFPAHFRAREQGLGRRRADPGRIVLAAAGRGQHPPGAFGALERVVDIAAQHRVGADFDVEVAALLHGARGRLLEADRLADVAPPVAGVELLAGQFGAVHRRIERAGGGAGPQPVQRLGQFGLEAVHGRAVEGIVQVQPLARHAALLQGGLQARQRRLVAGDGGAARAVVARHEQVGDESEFGQQGLRAGAVDPHGAHLAAALGEALQAAAVVDHADRVGQGQRAAGPGRGDLADAVPHHRDGFDALARQHAGDAHLQREERGLREFGAGNARGVEAARQFLGQAVTGQRLEQGVDLVDGGAEVGIVEQAPAHADPLRAVAGIDEDGAVGVGQLLGGIEGGAGLVVGVAPQRGRGVGGLPVAVHQGAVLVPVAAARRLVGGIVAGLGVQRVEMRGQVARRGAQRLRAAARYDEREAFGAGRVGAGCRFGVRVGAMQDHVRIGAAEAERVHADHQASGGRQRLRPGHDVEIPFLGEDRRIQLADADGGGHQAVLQAVDGLDQAGHAGRRFQVPHVALHRADGQGPVGGARLPQRYADRARFYRVAHRRAGAVGLQVIDLAGRDAGAGVGRAQQVGLRLGAGHGQAGLAAVGIDRGAGHDGQDPVAVGEGAVQVLEQEQAAAFGTHVAVARRVEHVAAALARQHRGLGEHQEAVGMQVQADAASQRLRDLAGFDRAAGVVEGHQGRRAGGVHGQARAAQVEQIGNAIGGDAGGVAGGERRVDHAQVLGHAMRVIRAGDADIDAAIAAAQARRLDARVLERFPGELQQHALLRIHQACFTRRDAEEARVETGDVAQRARRARVGGAGVLTQGMEIGVRGPASGIDLGDEVAAFQEVGPVTGGVGAGKSERESNESNTLCHVESF